MKRISPFLNSYFNTLSSPTPFPDLMGTGIYSHNISPENWSTGWSGFSPLYFSFLHFATGCHHFVLELIFNTSSMPSASIVVLNHPNLLLPIYAFMGFIFEFHSTFARFHLLYRSLCCPIRFHACPFFLHIIGFHSISCPPPSPWIH